MSDGKANNKCPLCATQIVAYIRQGRLHRGAPHFPDSGQLGRGAPHFPDGVAAGQQSSSHPRWWGGRAEALLTSQTGHPGRGAPHFPDGWRPGRGTPQFPDGGAAGQRCSSLPRRGGWAETLLTSQSMGQRRAEALLTLQMGWPPGRGAPHFLDGVAAWQRHSSLPRWGCSWAETLLTSQMVGRLGRGASHFPDSVRGRGRAEALPHIPDGGAAGQRHSSLRFGVESSVDVY
ncbi:uncharacterized protein LOC129395233 [Pan paniscus]|uniref:uncharacterized protein LOC129395233 n=1 Tax=Pan paniscus TaxID=9597 RepID=UPI0024369549|nr:uncharacterized protein LOC129395233 [Pan paniscus]